MQKGLGRSAPTPARGSALAHEPEPAPPPTAFRGRTPAARALPKVLEFAEEEDEAGAREAATPAARDRAPTRAFGRLLFTRGEEEADPAQEDVEMRGSSPEPAAPAETRGRGKGGVAVPEPATAAGPEPICAPDESSLGPLLLVLDPALQQLPWESVPCLRGIQRVYRPGSLPLAMVQALRLQLGLSDSAAGASTGTEAASMRDGDEEATSKAPGGGRSTAAPAAKGRRKRGGKTGGKESGDQRGPWELEEDKGAQSSGGGTGGIAQALQRNLRLSSGGSSGGTGAGPAALGLLAAARATSAYYLVNPSGDLEETQGAFEDWFRGLPGWEGRAGAPPSSGQELAQALGQHDLFVYMGHGGGEQYLPTRAARRLDRCATALLVGCSSGRLREQGDLEPSGPVLGYLLGGCPAAVANLWDVTDKDIDRFARSLLEFWLGSGQPRCLAGAIGGARGVCKLPFLIGAAPVVYGIPTGMLPPAADPKR